MTLFTLGLNHETAPVAVRERVSFSSSHTERALLALQESKLTQEVVILSTCNRTELYCKASSSEALTHWLAEYHQLSRQELVPYLYTYPEAEAVRHAFRVASGLNSMVLGEPQILGQVRHAIDQAKQAGSLGMTLHRLFQNTLTVAKYVRSTTEIGTASISMASAIVKLAERLFPSLSEQRVLLVGAGDMIDLVATHFSAAHPRSITIANRTLDHARPLADRLSAELITLEDIPEYLPYADITVSCTASPLPLIGKGAVERALVHRKHYPMLMIDLAVPRDIEPEVGALEDVFLYTVDDLATVIQQGLKIRQSAVAEAEAIIEAEVHHFISWQKQRAIVPVIQAIQTHAEAWRLHELKKAHKALARGDSPETVLENLSNALTKKWMHHPLSQLNTSEAFDWSKILTRLYKLDTNPREGNTLDFSPNDINTENYEKRFTSKTGIDDQTS